MFFALDVYLAWQAGKYVAQNYDLMTVVIAAVIAYFLVSRVAAVVGLIAFLIYRNMQLEKRLGTK